MKRCTLIILTLLNLQSARSQETFDFIGHVTSDGSKIPFELHITFERQEVTGYSVTWKGMLYETITKLDLEVDTTGDFATLKFMETSEIQTRFRDANREFCYLRGKYIVHNEDGKSVIKGTYQADNAQGESCGPGSLELWSDEPFPPRKPAEEPEPQEAQVETVAQEPEPQDLEVQNLAEETPLAEEADMPSDTLEDNAIASTDTALEDVSSYNSNTLDTVREGFLVASNTYTYTTNSGTLRLQFADFSNPDGDSISVYINDKALANNVMLDPNLKDVLVPLTSTGTDTIKVRILNEGRVSPNTSFFNFFDDGEQKYYNFMINGLKDEELILLIFKGED